MDQPEQAPKPVKVTHEIEAHQMLLIGIVGTSATLLTFVFLPFMQAISFGLLSGVFAYSLILSSMEREDKSTWKSANHWDEANMPTNEHQIGQPEPPVETSSLS